MCTPYFPLTQIEQLLGFITQAQTTVKTMAGPSFGDITQTIKSFFTNSLRQANHSALFDDIGPVDTRKAEVYLQSSGEFFSEIFDVRLLKYCFEIIYICISHKKVLDIDICFKILSPNW